MVMRMDRSLCATIPATASPQIPPPCCISKFTAASLPNSFSSHSSRAYLACGRLRRIPTTHLCRDSKNHTYPFVPMAAVVVPVTVPSWENLLEQLGDHRDPPFRLSHAKTRTFNSGQEPAITFYRDNSSWCPYCERVWIQLEEKQIPYEVEKINMRCYGDKPEWYTRMVPSGLLPAINLKGKIIPESMDIMLLLEDAFPNHRPLLPPKGTAEASAVSELLKLERRVVGAWLGCLRGGFWGAMNGFDSAMDSVDACLRQFGGPYFLGSELSLVDAVYAPFLERIAASIPYWLGPQVRGAGRWPAIDAWFDAMDSRPSYQAIKSDDFTITHTLEPQIGKCRVLPAGAAYRAKIDGKDGSWDLPLKPEETAWGRDDGSGSGFAKEEAARSLILNHEAIVRFSLRAVENPESYEALVDVGFRHVAYALLSGLENAGDLPADLPKVVAVAAAHLRDRVGVPRDLTYPAARQLRAHLQWLVKSLGSNL